jgi:hypothetical protein
MKIPCCFAADFAIVNEPHSFLNNKKLSEKFDSNPSIILMLFFQIKIE